MLLSVRSAQDALDCLQILRLVSTKATSRCGVQIGRCDDDQTDAVAGNHVFAAGVVDSSLNPSVNSTDRQSVRLVEVWHGTVVLPLAVLHDDVRLGPVPVYRELCSTAVASWIPAQPIEPVLPQSDLLQRQIAQIEDIDLITALPFHCPDGSC